MSTVEHVSFTTTGETREFRLFGPIMLVGGEPTWEVTDRRRRQPVTSWGGRALYGLEIPIVLDGWASRTPVGDDLLWLRGLLAAEDDTGAKGARQLLVASDGLFRIPNMDVRTKEWVATALELEPDSIIRAPNGALLRAIGTLSLLEYVAPPNVTAETSFTKAAAGGRVLTMVAKRGDTPLKLSLRRGVKPADRPKVKAFFMRNKIIPNKKYRIPV